MADFTVKDYTEELGNDIVSKNSVLNGFDFTDPLDIDTDFDGIPVEKILFRGAQIRKKTYEDTSQGIWIGIDADGLAKINIGDGTNSLTWDGTSLDITGEVTASSGTIGGWVIGSTSLTGGGGNIVFDASSTGELKFLNSSNEVASLTTSYDSGSGVGSFSILTVDGTGLVIETDVGASTSGSSSLAGYGGVLHSSGSASAAVIGMYRTSSSSEYFHIARAGGATTLKSDLPFSTPILLVDGVTAPSAVSGQAKIYVDASDGDLKVKFGDGFVATLAADS